MQSHGKMGRVARAASLVLAAAGLGVLAVPAMAADACSISSHCYGVAAAFTNEEPWQGTDNSTGLDYRVELGGGYGWPNGATPYWFCAATGNDSWAVQGPNWRAVSTSNPFSGRAMAMETGAESPAIRRIANGNIQDRYYLDTAGDLYSGWSGASIQPPSSIITSISWVGSGHNEPAWSTGSCD